MSTQDFPASQYFSIFQTNEEAIVGSFTNITTELAHMQLTCFIKDGTGITTERFRVKIYADENKNALLYTSDWSNFSDISELPVANWRGLIRVNWNRENVNENTTYHWSIEMNNYTPTASFEIGFGYAWPWPRYGTTPAGSTFENFPIDMGLFGYKDFTL